MNLPTKATPEPDSEPEARTSIDLSADAAAVWEALVTEDGLAAWMGEGSFIDPEIGGVVQLADPVGGRRRSGRVERVDQGACLEFSWWPDARPVERTTVAITLTPIESGTRVTVIESRPVSDVRIGSAAMSAGRPIRNVGSLVSADRSARTRGGAWVWRLAMLSLTTTMAAV